MTREEWEYRSGRLEVNSFTMHLTFEEEPTLKALRKFVSATESMPADSTIEIGTAFKSGGYEVATISARHTSQQRSAVPGPQPVGAPESTETGMTELDAALQQMNPTGAVSD